MRVAILGLGKSARDFNSTGFDQVYALPWDAENAAKGTTLFEMHQPQLFTHALSGRPPDYLDQLRHHAKFGELIMQQAYEDIPGAIEYPLQVVKGFLGEDYFGSSPALMIGYALWRRASLIHLAGVDLTDSIYDHQRPNLEWLLGFAKARGVYVTIAPGGKLMAREFQDTIGEIKVTYPLCYGYDPVVIW